MRELYLLGLVNGTKTGFTSVIFHGTALSIMLWGFNSLSTIAANEWISKQKGGHFQFLTIQGLVLAALTMSLSLICDLLPNPQLFQTARRALLIIALPVSFDL